jgi:hypothetical protein
MAEKGDMCFVAFVGSANLAETKGDLTRKEDEIDVRKADCRNFSLL